MWFATVIGRNYRLWLSKSTLNCPGDCKTAMVQRRNRNDRKVKRHDDSLGPLCHADSFFFHFFIFNSEVMVLSLINLHCLLTLCLIGSFVNLTSGSKFVRVSTISSFLFFFFCLISLSCLFSRSFVHAHNRKLCFWFIENWRNYFLFNILAIEYIH